MAASLLSESAGDEPTASVGVGAGLAIVRPVMSWKGRFNSKILLKLAKSIAQMANCPREKWKSGRREVYIIQAVNLHTYGGQGTNMHRQTDVHLPVR